MAIFKRPKVLVATHLLGGHSWIFIVLQAVVAMLLGALFILKPLLALPSLAVALGVLLLLSGVQQFYLLTRRRRFRFWRTFYALFLSLAGGFLLAYPLWSGLMLLRILAVWFIFHAFEQVVAAWNAHRLGNSFRAVVWVNGGLSLICGLAILFFPMAGAVFINFLLAFYLMLYGMITMSVGLSLNAVSRALDAAAHKGDKA